MADKQRERVVKNLTVSSEVTGTYSEKITAFWDWHVAKPGMWDRQSFRVTMRAWNSNDVLIEKKETKSQYDVETEEVSWQVSITFPNADEIDHYSIEVWCKNQGPPFGDNFWDSEKKAKYESRVTGGGEEKVCCKDTSTGKYEWRASCGSGYEKVSDVNCEAEPGDVCCMNKTTGTSEWKPEDTCKSLSNWKVVSDKKCEGGGKSLLENILYFIKQHKLLLGAGGGLFFLLLIIFVIAI